MVRWLAILLSAVATVHAQGGAEEQMAIALLSSQSVVDRACGAFLAGRLHNPSLDKLLIEQMQQLPSDLSQDAREPETALALTLFDALIESGATVPQDTLLRFKKSFPDEVLILLTRNKPDEALLMEWREDKGLSEAGQFAVNNRLLRMRSSRFFVKTLQEVKVLHKFTVQDKDSTTGYGTERAAFSCADGTRQLAKGFPLISLYQLISGIEEAAVLLVAGPTNVSYRVIGVPQARGVWWGGCERLGITDVDRLKYLEGFVGKGEPAETVLQQESDIRWSDEDAFRRQVEDDLQVQGDEILGFAARAKEKGVEGLSGVVLTLAAEIEDRRSAPTGALNAIAPRRIVIP